ncbi:unnamed protein product [Meganyctiphanes norvegica]|uniref:UMA domain-containing protein n=1 Tax=Meganyctiphanes norvegica TaxID=48144 RepID=A0AAV2QRW6_MEGNR
MSMFRLFGRRKSPVEADGEGAVEGEPSTENGVDALSHKDDILSSDGFVMIDGSDQNIPSSTFYDPPPGYSLEAANAFIHSNSQSRINSAEGLQSYDDDSNKTAIDGIPFKYGANVILKDQTHIPDSTAAQQMISRINAFNWDDYEYNFELENSILKEFSSQEEQIKQEDSN